jgi:hypothetical protein
MWKLWLTGIIGLGIVLVGLMGLSGLTLTWTLIVTGFLVAALSFWAAGAIDEEEERLRNPYMDSVFQ